MAIGSIFGTTSAATLKPLNLGTLHYPPTGYNSGRSLLQTAGDAFNGGLNAYQNSAGVAAAIKGVGSGAQGGLKALGGALLKGTRMSLLIGAGVSAVTNSIDIVSGRITIGRGLGNIAADGTGAAISGVVAAGAGGLATLALGAMGVVSAPMLAGVSAVAGIAGFIVSGHIFDASPFRRAISDTIAGVL